MTHATTKVIQSPNESRINYLMRCLEAFMHDTIAGAETIIFDEAECDGYCLAQDIIDELGIDLDSDFPALDAAQARMKAAGCV